MGRSQSTGTLGLAERQEEEVKKLIIVFGLCLFSVFPNTSISRDYTNNELIKMGSTVIEGVVDTVKVYNFFLELDSGDNLNVLTNTETKILPAGDRLYKGDRVRVALFEPIDASDSIASSSAYSIEIIKHAQRNFIKSPKIGICSVFRARNTGAFYFEDIKKLIKFENLDDSLSVGKKYEVFFKVVPANIGNGYVYVAEKATMVGYASGRETSGLGLGD